MERVIDLERPDQAALRRESCRLPAAGTRDRAALPWALTLTTAALFVLADQIHHRVTAGAPPAWSVHVRRMDQALARGDIRGAIRPWNQAYSAAVRSDGWEGMAAVGEAYLRLTTRLEGRGDPAIERARPIVARGIFESALIRGHQQASREAVLRAAEGFTAIGDQAMADRCHELAARLVPREGTS